MGLVAGVLLVLPSVAAGQTPARLKAAKQGSSPNVVVLRGPDGHKKIVFQKPMDIISTHHRPHAAYLLARSKVGFSLAPPYRALVERIPPTVRKSPF